MIHLLNMVYYYKVIHFSILGYLFCLIHYDPVVCFTFTGTFLNFGFLFFNDTLFSNGLLNLFDTLKVVGLISHLGTFLFSRVLSYADTLGHNGLLCIFDTFADFGFLYSADTLTFCGLFFIPLVHLRLLGFYFAMMHFSFSD